MPPSFSYVSVLFLLPAAISAVTYDCKKIQADQKTFNLEKLGGPKQVNHQVLTQPTITNTTFTLDICAPLKKTKENSKEQCPGGTRVCGVKRVYEDDGHSVVQEVIPIAGEYAMSDGRHLNAKFTRLKDSSSHEDSQREGIRAELHGGKYEKKEQKAIIEFLCDKELEGTEGFEDSKAMDLTSYSSMRKRESKDDDGEDHRELPDLDKGKALQFVSYKDESDVGVLRLKWKTKYACEDAPPPKKGSGDKAAGWGFFTWFLIIVFLLAASYIIFGSWLNYNRYGARGWDLIPHGDTIRDIPYIVKDWTSGMVDRTRGGGGGGSRGGYSAVSI